MKKMFARIDWLRGKQKSRDAKRNGTRLLKNQRLRLESLEDRLLLAVTAGETVPAAVLPEPTGATTWVVNTLDDPDHYYEDETVSLREAIERAASGDKIEFDSSLTGQTIRLNVALSIGKNITIDATSIGGITIDAGKKCDSVFSYTSDSELVKLTITGSKGAGVSGSVKLTDSVITGNAGGGVSNGYSVAITNSKIYGNTGTGVSGTTVTITNSSIYGNTASSSSSSTSSAYGGVYGSTVTITNSSIYGNTASSSPSAYGGVYGGTVTITNSSIYGNTASSSSSSAYGGVSGGTVTITNSTIYGNTASSSSFSAYGGVYGSEVTITNATISGNSATAPSSSSSVGGVYGGKLMTLSNTIAAFNYASTKSRQDIYTPSTYSGSNNIIGVDPGFVTAPHFTSGRLDNLDTLDLSLSSESWGIDRGKKLDTGEMAKMDGKDVAGNKRVVNGTIDIGAYEYQGSAASPETPSTIVTTAEDLLNPTDGLISLREAVIYASSGNTITFASSLAGQTITLSGAELFIDKNLTIDASAIGGMIIDADGRSRVLCVNSSSGNVVVELISVTVENGAADNGAGVYNQGTLILTESIVKGNNGVGIYNAGTLNLTDSEISENTDRGIYNVGTRVDLDSTAVSNNSTTGSGGGIYNASGSLTIIGSTISGNSAESFGGGILNAGTIEISDTSISENIAQIGGGVSNGYYYHSGSSTRYVSGYATITNTVISGNKSTDSGGGIYNSYDSTLTMIGSTISENIAEGSGGGIYNYNGTQTFTATTISGNTTSSNGGGIYNYNGTLTFIAATISRNIASSNGGGVYNSGTLKVVNSIIFANESSSSGGGVYNYLWHGTYNTYYGDITLINVTISGNTAKEQGGGFDNADSNAKLDFTNSIILLNYAAKYPDLQIQGGRPSGKISTDIFYDGEAVDSDARKDPGFVVAPEFRSGVLRNPNDIDLHLLPGSRAINAGTNDVVETKTDLDGNPRITGGIVDIGAYEFYVDGLKVTTLLDIVDENDSVNSLREAIAAAEAGDTITFDEKLAGGTISLELGQLAISKGITIDATSVGGITIDAGGKSRVFYVSGGDSSNPVKMVQLTVTGGAVSGSGAGIYNESGTLNLIDMTISGNTATGGDSRGGGLYNAGTMAVSATRIRGNSAESGSAFGAGVYNAGTITFENSEFFNNALTTNAADSGGGALYNAGTANLYSCTVAGNSSKNSSLDGDEQFRGSGIFNSGELNVYNGIIALNAKGYNLTSSSDATSGHFVMAPNFKWTTPESVIDYDETLSLFKENPDFRADGVLLNPNSANLSLSDDSQAIDLGSLKYLRGDLDLAGKPRVNGETIDLGAYENDYTGVRPLAVPRNFSVKAQAPTDLDPHWKVDLSWKAVTHAGYYMLRWSTDQENWNEIRVNGTDFEMTVSDPLLTYYFTVQAFPSSSNYTESALSPVISKVPGVLDVPENLEATTTGVTTVSLSWSAVENADSYIVRYWTTTPSDYTEITVGDTVYTLTGMKRNLTYHISVCAVDSEENFKDSDFCDEITVIPGRLATPVNVKAEVLDDDSSIRVSWDPVANADSYRIFWRVGSSAVKRHVDTTETSYTFTGLDRNFKYYFSVQALGSIPYSDSNISSPEVSAGWSGLTVVTTAEDEFDLSNSVVSLREAIYYAGTTVDGVLLPTTITFDPDLSGMVCVLSSSLGALSVDKSVTIDASDLDGGFTVDGNGANRVFTITGSSNEVELIGLTIQNGFAPVESAGGALARGGGIYSTAGLLTLTDCVVTGNTAQAEIGEESFGNAIAYGGGIYAEGALCLSGTTVSNNSALATTYTPGGAYRADAFGGGIYAPDFEITHSFVSGNLAQAVSSQSYAVVKGGGIYGSGSVVNSLVVRNAVRADSAKQVSTSQLYALAFGGGICQETDLTITNSTIAKNSAWSTRSKDRSYYAHGGGFCAVSNLGTVTINNSIVLLNNTSYIGALDAESLYPVGDYDGYDICLYTDSDDVLSGNNNISTYDGWSDACADNVLVVYTYKTKTAPASIAVYYDGVSAEYFGEDALQEFLDDFFVNVYDSTVPAESFDTEDYRLCDAALWAVDAGNVSLAVEADGTPIADDLDGRRRVIGDAVDIGAYETGTSGEGKSLLVTTVADVIDPEDGETSLREAILYAEELGGGTVTFINPLALGEIILDADLGTITISSPITIDASNLLNADGDPSLLISGANLSLSDRILTIEKSAGEVSLLGLIFTYGMSNDIGGAIYSEAESLVLTNDQFLANTAIGAGGAVYTTGDLAINGGSLENNISESFGGAVYVGGALSVSGTLFRSNVSESGGGAVYALSSVKLEDATFNSNHAASLGGAVYSGGTVTAGNSTFTKNTSESGSGGAIYASSSVELTNVEFTTSSASLSGGAVYSGGTVTVNDAAFTGNTSESGSGGAIYAVSSVELTGGIFNSNAAALLGGALYAGDAVTVNGSVMTGNRAESGGAIYAVLSAELTGGAFNSNIAASFGGALYAGDAVTVNDSGMAGNSAESGGAIYAVSSAELTGGAFNSNIAASLGGALYASDAITVNDSTMAGNRAENGGAVYAVGVLSVADSKLIGNAASGSGGAFAALADAILKYSILSENTAVSKGGAVWQTAGSLTAINTQFDNNTSVSGGGICIACGTQAVLRNATVTANTGSGLYAESGAWADLYNTIIAANTGDDITAETGAVLNAYKVLSSWTDWTNSSDGLWDRYSPYFQLFNETRTDGVYTLSQTAFQAIDKGNNDYAIDENGDPLTEDLLGGARFVKATWNSDDAIVDLGVHEYTESDGNNLQLVRSVDDPQVLTVLPGETFAPAIEHEVIKLFSDNNATTLSLRIHFDSSYLSFDPSNPGDYDKTELPEKQGNFPVYSDIQNYDGDDATDRYILVTWNNPYGLWDGAEIFEIFKALNFTVNSDFDTTADHTTYIRFSPANITANFQFLSAPIEIDVARVTFDIDGDGAVNLSTDVNLLLRYMAGKREETGLTDNLTYNASTRDAKAIEAFLATYSDVFDIDGDGIFNASIDGELLARSISGFTGDDLVHNISFTSASVRTDPDELISYVKMYLTGVTETTPDGYAAQVITPSVDSTVVAGTSVTLNLDQSISPANDSLTATTLSLRLYYDSDYFTIDPSVISYYTAGLVGPALSPIVTGSDTANEDGDSATDSWIQITWNCESGWTWDDPLLGVPIAVNDVSADSDTGAPDSTIHITALDRTAGWAMDDIDIPITIIPSHFTGLESDELWLFDIDGSGTVDIATDGNLLLRYCNWGPQMNAEDLLVDGVSTRSEEEIFNYLKRYRQAFDIDGDGDFNLHYDVTYFLKFFAGYRGNELQIADPAENATRKTGDALAAYIKQFIPENQRTDPVSAAALPKALSAEPAILLASALPEITVAAPIAAPAAVSLPQTAPAASFASSFAHSQKEVPAPEAAARLWEKSAEDWFLPEFDAVPLSGSFFTSDWADPFRSDSDWPDFF